MSSATDEQMVEQLASEVDVARDSLGQLVMRLDRKRHAVGRTVPLVLVLLALAAIGGSFCLSLILTRPRVIDL